MSSIYDALRRIQGEKGTWTTPLERKEQPAALKKKPGGRVVAVAVVLVAVCAAGIYYGVTAFSGSAKDQAPALAAARTAPVYAHAVRTHPRAVHLGQPPRQAALPAPAAQPAPPGAPPMGDTLESLLKAGEGAFNAHNYDRALVSYNKALHYFGKDVRVLNNIGSVYLAQGNPEEAIHYFTESKQMSQDYVEPVYNLACAYARLGDPAKAVSNLKKACRLNPEAKQWAASDPDLSTLRGHRAFDRLVGAQ